jgi:hypothetical protein
MDKETLARMFGDIFTTCTTLSEEVLARYVELEIAGQEPHKQLPEVGAHLDECADCAARYTELLAALGAEVRGAVSSISPSRPFDLQFLSTSGADLWVEVKETVHRLVTEIPIVIQQAVASFGPLPTALASYRVTVAPGTVREIVETTHKIESLQIPNESANLLFSLTPGPVDADEKGVTLVLKVETLQSGEPLGQVRVSLHDSQERLLQSKTTTADGRVVFRSLAGDYALRCKHAGQTWGFSVSIGTEHVSLNP